MKRHGFTLIELLAVIVIMAIIALIATPLILNMIEKAKRDSFLNSAYGITKAAEYAYAENELFKIVPGELVFIYENGEESSNVSGLSLNYSGTKLKEGTVVVRKDGKYILL